ncbi:hypothetical protein L7F22_016954 [Adiantum nelumboides]|nr:hypothetical protein [Adiantum nelumboides]
MAVQVLDYLGLPTMQRTSSDDGCEVMSASFQRMQQLMNLLSHKQVQQAQDACSHILDVAGSDIKKVLTLPGGLGHARFRRAPGVSPSSPSPSALFRSSPSGRSPTAPSSPPQIRSPSSSPFRDVDCSQVRCSADVPMPEAHSGHPSFACRPCNNEGTAERDAHGSDNHIASHIVCQDMHTKHVSELCNLGEKEQNADGSVYDANAPHGLARCQEGMTKKSDNHASATNLFSARPCAKPDQAVLETFKTNSSFVSSLSNEERGGTVSSGKPLFSSARPPLPPKKRKVTEKMEETSRKCHKSGQCHCADKRRKLHTRTVIRVPMVFDVMSSDTPVPDDGYSWCTCGQKLVEGSLYPRVYYRCSSVRGCPARKHVERASEDSSVVIVTYGRKHMHPQIQKVAVSSG